tara:strand:- start:23328 stop:23702 length:375 start_codon:yes stop_codon:yes gene_type:complete
MSFAITITHSGQHFECADGENVLEGMLCRGREGISVGCRGGGCGVCKVRVLEGEYRTKTMSAACVNAEERAAGYALACKLFPESNLLLEVVGRIGRSLARKTPSSSFHFYTSVEMSNGVNNLED